MITIHWVHCNKDIDVPYIGYDIIHALINHKDDSFVDHYFELHQNGNQLLFFYNLPFQL